ncbi:hypothetical protein MBLNU13_g02255t1 [Cladosporium sp. NU13]
MARLSAAGAPATPEQTEESEERSSTGAGAMATSNASINARQRDNASPGIRGMFMFSNTTHTGAMGQTESRETVRARNNALHRAPGQALRTKPGKLPRRSGGLPHAVSGQRRLGRNVLADANTYDVPSDDEPAPSRRQAATTAQFSPLKRQIQQQSREERRRQEERERQAALDRQLDLDWERESERVVEDIESRREGAKAGLSGEDAAVHEVSESDASGMQSNADAVESEMLMNALNEPVPEPPQHSAAQKKRGRLRKSRPDDREQEQASEQPRRKRGQPSIVEREVDQPRRKRGGRPSNAEREAEARRAAAHKAVGELIIRSVLVGMTDELSPTSPPQVAQVTTAPNRQLQRSLQTSAAEPVASPSALDDRPRQASIENVARNGSDSRHRVSASNYGDSLFVQDHDDDRPDIVRPTELDDINSVQDNDQTLAADEQFAGEAIDQSRESTDDQGSEDDDDDEDEDEDEDEHLDETEIRLNATANDRHRLYGHWHKVREVMREVAKHGGTTVRIKDAEFKEVLQACRDATTTVNQLAVDINPNVLEQTVLQCRDAIARARSVCGTGEPLVDSGETRKRGFHIFKHLLPTLARLLRAAIKAFERVDKVDVDTEQIPLGHLSKIIELLSAVVQCGESAYRSYQALSRPIKQDVHKGITVHFRELHSNLTAKYTTEFRRREEQQLNEGLEREIAAREEERERQVQWRKLELHNQDKWKRMNKARFDVSKNSGDIKKQHHLRSCGMQLVQTDADGQPYLPTTLRGRRGMWTEHESTTLETSLRNNVDTPAPLDSMVFEKIIAEECKFRRPLANKNVLEIVIEANEIKDFWINWRRDTGAPTDEWVQKIPRWMDPPRSQHDNGSSAEDAIEIE